MLFHPAARTAAALFLVVSGLTACGAGGSGTAGPLVPATAAGPTVDAALPAQLPIAQPPTASSALTVTGEIVSTAGSTAFTVQAGPGCGYLTIYTSKTTALVTNGLRVAPNTYARATGTGSCATKLNATSVVLAASANGPFSTAPPVSSSPVATPTPGPASSPTPAPKPTSSPTPAPKPTSSAAPVGPPPIVVSPPAYAAPSAANYTAIVNGQPWPSSFRPFSATSPVNQRLPETPANTDAAGTSKLRAYLRLPSNPFYGVDQKSDTPVYLGHASDPLVTLSIQQSNDGCPAQVHLPAQARAPNTGDSHMSIIESDGTLLEFWLAKYSGGPTLTAAYCANVPGGITGSSLIPSGLGVTDGNAVIAELIRFSELSSGTIPHALRTVVPCVNGLQQPVGSSNGAQCPDGMGVALGTRFYLALSDAQIDALPSSTVQPYMRPILHALHQYGAYVTDTGFFSPPESNNALNFIYESGLTYNAYGVTSPGAQFAASHGFANNGDNWIDNNPINWPALAPYMFAVSSCYASGSCVS